MTDERRAKLVETMGDELLSSLLSAYSSYGDPRSDWLHYKGAFPSSSREENYLRVTLLDTEDASHDALTISEEVNRLFDGDYTTFSSLLPLKEVLTTLSFSPFLSMGLVKDEDIRTFIVEASRIEKAARALKKGISSLLELYGKEVLRLDGDTLKRVRDGEFSSPLKRMGREYKSLLKRMEDLKRDGGSLDYEEVKSVSSKVLKLKKARSVFKRIEDKGPDMGPLYKGLDTDWEEYVSQLSRFKKALRSVKDREALSQGTTFRTTLMRLEDLESRYGDGLENCVSFFGDSILTMPFSELEKKMASSSASLNKLQDWIDVRSVFEEAEEKGVLEAFWEGVDEKIDYSAAVNELWQEKEESPVVEEETKEELFPLLVRADIKALSERYGVVDCSSPGFSGLVREFVDTEGPISERDSVRRLSEMVDDEDMTPKRIEEIKGALMSLEGETFKLNKGFLYPLSRGVYFRRTEERRDFSHIAPEELLDGMTTILRHYGGMEKEELFQTLGSNCGMKSVLSVRYRELEKILLSSSVVKEREGKIVLEEME